MRRLIPAALVVLASLATLSHVASADQIAGAQFVLDAASAPANINAVNVNVNAGILGSGNGTVGISGLLLADFDFDASSGKINSFRVNGNISTYHPFVINVGLIPVSISQISGNVASDSPPTMFPVNETNSFLGSDHKITLNSGSVSALGSGIDFAAQPVFASGVGAGNFSSTPNGNGFDGVITIPFAATVPVLDGAATVTVNGNLRASGFFASSTVPEPTSGLFLAGAAIAACGRRRRRV